MLNRTFWAGAAGVVAGALFVQTLGECPELGIVPPVQAGEMMHVAEGETFVSTDGGNAYLWRRDGDRLVLINHCKTVESAQGGQSAYVSLPGVERGS